MRGLFITGTDTSVGKTAVLAALLCALRRAGRDAVPMKPVQTGCRRGRDELIPPDLVQVLDAAGLRPDAAEKRLMCPFRYAPACSPHLAAAQSKHVLRLDGIISAFVKLSSDHELVLVEGAGGVLVPLSRRHTMLDLMKQLALPVVIAARPGLGTLNHTLLTLGVVRQAGLKVAGVVMVCTRPGRWGPIEQNNLETIRRLSHLPVHRMSYAASLRTGRRRPSRLPEKTVREASTWIGSWRL